MINEKQILVVIPARGGSKGLPGKNIKLLNNIPLIAHSIKYAKECSIVNKIVVSTDCKKIAKIAVDYGAEVIDRPDSISGDKATTESAINHTLNLYILELEVALKESCVSETVVDFLKNENIDVSNSLQKTCTELWTRQEILIVFNMLKEIESAYRVKDNLKTEALIQSLDKILELKETKIYMFITESSTVLD